jgi:hypothetical protein
VAQRRPREVLRFEAVEAAQAVVLARAHAAAARAFLAGVAQRRGTLLERLFGHNLVSGMVRAGRED